MHPRVLTVWLNGIQDPEMGAERFYFSDSRYRVFYLNVLACPLCWIWVIWTHRMNRSSC